MRAHCSSVSILSTAETSHPVSQPQFRAGVERLSIFRDEFYGDHFPEQVYFEVVGLQPRWRAILDQYNIRLVLIRRTSALATVLSADPAWQSVYTGEIEQLFVRKEAGP